jgi:hypothetical protein
MHGFKNKNKNKNKYIFDVLNKILAFQIRNSHFENVLEFYVFLLVHILGGHSKFVQLFFINHFCIYLLKN